MNSLLRFFNVQAEEKGVLGTLFLFQFAIGTARFFVLTPALAIFLERFDAEDLGLIYILVAIPLVATSMVYVRLGRVLKLRTLIVGTLGFLIGLTFLIRVALGLDANWPALLPPVWFFILFTLTSSAFAATATRVLDIRQSKRLIPLATTGDVLAFFVGGMAIPSVVRLIGTPNLLYISMGGAGLAGLVFLRLSHVYAGRFAPRRQPQPPRKEIDNIDWSGSYLRLMVGYFAFSALVFVLIDNAFNLVAEQRYADTAELASFFGTYSAVAAVANLLFKSVLTGRLVSRFGVIGILLSFPLVIALGSSLVAISGFMAVGLVFWLTTMTRLFNKVFLSAQYATFPTLTHPLGESSLPVQATLEGIVEATAYGVSGLLLLGIHTFFDIGAVELSFLLIVVCAGWLYVSLSLRREYTGTLSTALHRRRLGPSALNLSDNLSLDLVMKELESPYPENTLYALSLLEEFFPENLPAILIGLLAHKSDEVRLEALDRVERLHFDEALEAVKALAEDKTNSSTIRGAATRVRWVLSDDDIHEGILGLSDPDTEFRIGTMVGMLRSGSVEGIVYGGHCLLDSLRSPQPEDRIFAAKVLGESEIEQFYKQALSLLDDPNVDVRNAAIQSIPRIGHARLWPRAVDALRYVELAGAASEALIAGGAAPVDSLVAGFKQHPSERSFRLSVLRILGLIREDTSEEIWGVLVQPDPEKRHAALVALSNCSFEASEEQVPRLRTLLEGEVADAVYRYSAIADLSETSSTGLLRDALEFEIHRIRHRVFRILSFLYPGNDAMTAWDNYTSDDKDKRAYALELVENLVSSHLKDLLFPVLEHVGVDDRLVRLRSRHQIERMPVRERLDDLTKSTDAGISKWTRSCASHVAVQLGLESDPDEVSIVRQALRLKSVELFDNLPEHVIAGIIPQLQEVHLEANEEVFSKGEVGDAMYVVLDGTVRVHDGDTTIADIGKDGFFGEMTVLQSAPRTFSVTTRGPSRLCRFSQDALYRLIADQVGVARSLIQIIVQRLQQNRAMKGKA